MIEPAAGADRATLAFLVDAYDEEEVEGDQRTLLRLHPRLAPVKVAVLPLVRKDGQPELARELYDALRGRMQAEYDEGGSIGKRYRRQDEIGTPWCITIDHQSLEDRTVTLRDRDSLAQERLPIDSSRPCSASGSPRPGARPSWTARAARTNPPPSGKQASSTSAGVSISPIRSAVPAIGRDSVRRATSSAAGSRSTGRPQARVQCGFQAPGRRRGIGPRRSRRGPRARTREARAAAGHRRRQEQPWLGPAERAERVEAHRDRRPFRGHGLEHGVSVGSRVHRPLSGGRDSALH